MIVCKFGGSSLSSAKKINIVKDIVQSNSERKIIVLSALGKENSNDEKLTDLLISLTQKRPYDFYCEFDKIIDKIKKISINLSINPTKLFDFDLFYRQIKDLSTSNEYIISRGEYFTAKLIANYFNCQFISADKIIFLNERGKIDKAKTLLSLQKLNLKDKIIIPGFYCSNCNAKISLLGRGGSDLSGAIIASLLNAKLYENYTDVNGLLTCDTSLEICGKTVTNLNYSQLYTCTLNGAQVFFKDSISHLAYSRVQTNLINTLNPMGSKSEIFNKGSFYYFGKLKKYKYIPFIKNNQKSRIIKGIIKVFMFNKIKSLELYSIKNGVAIEDKFSLANNNKLLSLSGLSLFLFGKTYIRKKSTIINFLKNANLLFTVKNLPNNNKSEIFILGNINQTLLNKLKNLIEK